ncbi:deleted in malignant brain tumors 1 protein isoform X29 [Astyanax mexicanus]|uniref:deleted in malignant brain tumors 1 protein isoform X29 n=1 Tax=Astyanax mexicanus TaxID=7994 RepID=UPI0020CAE158|nr:deleted in malignant brain tumors 1 protein isoform X29 [Astyanax mexicanus]
MSDAAVVCRELGCGEAVDALGKSHFGSGSGPIWMDDVDCSGSESRLKNCRSPVWGKHDCNETHNSGVICSGARLVLGSRCSERVEVLHGESWATVCDADFNQQGAEVVCRELGCGSPVKLLGAAAFGRGEGQVWSEVLQCRGNKSQTHFCPKSSSLKHNCSHDNDVGLVCAGVLLVNGSRYSGRVEVLHGESWFTVCDADFNQQDAEVVCRELGCGSPVEILGAAAFGRGESPVWSEELQCRGSESQIHFCPKSSSLKHNCSHDNDVGLVCSGSGPIWMDNVHCSGSESTLRNCESAGWGKHNCDHSKDAGVICSGVRVVGGSHCSGRVEVLHGESWVTVCDADFNQQDAEVVCRELGCGSLVEVLGAAAFGRAEGQMWSEELQCRGNESHMYLCQTSPSLKPNCSHNKDVGLRCSGHTQARLMNGSDSCSGRVELQYLSEWGTVCDVLLWRLMREECGCLEGWSVRGRWRCSSGRTGGEFCWTPGVSLRPLWSADSWAVVLYSTSPAPLQHSYMCVTGFNCSGSEAHLRNCSSSQAVNCSSTVQLYITCSGTSNTVHSSIRLVGSGGDCAGRLEVFHSGSWGTVSDELWDIEDAQVVCRQLQCGVALSAPVPVPARFGSGTGPIWLNEVECEGNEASLWNCRYQLCGEDECGHKDDVGVVCSEHIPLRLRGGVGSCSGWLQVYHNKTWGSVCGDLWDIRDAQVICRQLGCGPALSANRRAADGSGGGTIWMNRVKCRGNEIHLWDCPHSLKNHTDCSHSAGVTCGGFLYHTLPLNNKRGQMGHFVLQDSQPQTRRIILPQTPPPAVPSIYPVSLLVLGSVLFLALVLLVVLFYQNRVLRRVISKRRKTSAEPVYEEIDTRLIPKRITVSTESKADNEEMQLSYDVIFAGQTPDSAAEEEPDNYDDVIVEQNSNIVMENMLEIYDDVMEVTAGHIAAVKVPPTSLHWTGYIFLESSWSDLQT